MKSIKSYIGVLMMAFVAILSSCSPDSFEGADPNGIPTLDGIEPVITVDQNINQVTFTLPADCKGCLPVWIFYENKGTEKEKVNYSTVNGLQRIFANAGDYEVEFKLMNRNGLSDGTKSCTFTIDNTIVNYDKYLTMLCGGKENAAKEWRIDNDKAGHLGCGEPATTGLNWWSAGANEKEGYGVYDCRLTFSSDYKYNFHPGESGQIYVNKDVVALGGPQGEDFCVDATEQEVEYKFETKGDDLYIVFPEHTFFPYIANDDIWNEPRYKVESITPSEINLVIDNGGIAWHYILTSGAAAVKFNGFKYDSEFNLWKTVDDTDAYSTHFWYAPNWNQIADPGFAKNGNEYTFTLPEATTDQWMAQCPLKPNDGVLHLSASKKYDMSCIISSNVDLPGVTVKLTDVNSGDNFVFVERVPVAAYEDYVFYVSDVNELSSDCDCELFFDFGGNPADATITVKNIVIKDHANDDGTVLPSDEPGAGGEDATMDWDANAGTNLWKAVEDGSAFISVTPWFADNGWGQIGDPEWSHENGVWSVTMPEGMGGSQWQGQFPINTTLTAKKGKKYNFYCVVEADNDCPGVTIKFTETDDAEKHDNNFFFADRHDIKAFEPFIYKAEGVELPLNDAHAMSLFFDFGGTPAGTNVKISKIYFEETVSMDYEDADNLWKAVDAGDAFISVTPWFADNGWGQIGDPEWSHSGNSWDLVIPEGMGGSQWQGQFPINTTLTADMNDTYNFSCTVEMDNDAPGVTIKLTETDDADKHDNNFFFADQHKISAYTPYVYTVKGVKLPLNNAHALSLFFDFGGTPAGTNVKISNIVFKKN
ncbi:MAG: hypothetical protein Q4D33_03230 [Prevotellaceae bacterium]|nr:hypothetical protein [Prevotellaceae bacterium]